MKRIFCGLLVFVALASCSESKHYPNATLFDRDDFKSSTITGKTIEFDDMIMNPFALQVYDTFLITYNTNVEKLFHIFSLPGKKKIGERVSMGQGPLEMFMPSFVNRPDSVELFDMMSSTVSRYSLSEFVNNPTPVPDMQVKLKEKPLWSELGRLDGRWIGVSYKPDAPCYLFSPEGTKLGGFGTYPESMSAPTDLEIIDTYRAILTTNGKDRVAVCHFFTDLIDIYDANGNLLKELQGPDHFFTQFKEFKEGDRVGSKPVSPETYKDAFYSPVAAGDEFFVLYNGKYIHEEGYDLLAKEIFTFDWNGSPKRHFLLDQGVSRITVDPRNKKIYGISNDPEYHIVEFDY